MANPIYYTGSILPSELCSSPIITICLRQASNTSSPTSLTVDESKKKAPNRATKRPRESRAEEHPGTIHTPSETQRDAARAVPEEYLATFRVHLSALTEKSLYFKSLLSFQGVEMTENKVVLEAPPLSGCDPQLIALAFKVFLDWSYSGTYNLANYPYMVEEIKRRAGRKVQINIGGIASVPATANKKDAEEPLSKTMCHGEKMVFTAILYVLADRLLVEEFRNEVLKDMYQTLETYTRVDAKCLRKTLTEIGEVDKKLYKSVTWTHMATTVKIIFDNTAEKSLGLSRFPKPAKSDIDARIRDVEVHHRHAWLGAENMRNLIAAFLAKLWVPSHSGNRKESRKLSPANVWHQMKIVEGNPDIMRPMMSYLMLYGVKTLDDIPRSDFGLPEGDWWSE
ncbi:hypothetical protein BJ508DRAFT_367534 [Ascobolus immersus RN42]|uniref:BTB domain-containing protein n=1 Tax=Ascobolus immersus RN42 TaxID=1160509 RepID=A0A3N4HQK6_ASCIM|nr:hypothetical protein BJ508DRAFT_367534 [Ascobolus immersus RN42]